MTQPSPKLERVLSALRETRIWSGGSVRVLLARLSPRDLRLGAFEDSEPRERHARDILWRLTIARLRRANPRFLNANGFS